MILILRILLGHSLDNNIHFPDNNHRESYTVLNDILKTITEYNSFCDESTGVELTV